MEKLKLIILREYLTKVKNKSFIVMTILTPLLTIAVGVLIVFLMKKNNEEIRKFAVLNESGQIENSIFKNTHNKEYYFLKNLSLSEAKDSIYKTDYNGLLYIPRKDSLEILENSIVLYSKKEPGTSLVRDFEYLFEDRIEQLKVSKLDIDLEKVKRSKSSVNLLTENFEGAKTSKEGNLLKIFIGGAFSYLLFMFLMIYGSMVMRSVIEEKNNRIIEIMISSVKPFQLMLGKIIGTAMAGLTQFMLWAVLIIFLSLIALPLIGLTMGDLDTLTASAPSPEAMKIIEDLNINESLIQFATEFRNLPLIKIVLAFVVYFLGGYLIYSSLYAAIGSAVDAEADTQQFMMPVMMPLIISIYVGMTTIDNPHGPISVAFSMFPLTSPVNMMIRIPFGVPTWQLIVSILLLILTFLFIVWFAAKIYRVGILMHGKKPSYKELYKWLKY